MAYRVHVPRLPYRGNDKKKLERQRRDSELCARIEVELQRRYDEIEPGQIRAILAHHVAWEIGADQEQVRQVMCRMQGGSNGVTFSKEPLPGEPWEHQRGAAKAPPPDHKGPSDHTTVDGKLSLGTRIVHSKFGDGVTVHIEGDHVTAVFEGAGTKKVLASFLKPRS